MAIRENAIIAEVEDKVVDETAVLAICHAATVVDLSEQKAQHLEGDLGIGV